MPDLKFAWGGRRAEAQPEGHGLRGPEPGVAGSEVLGARGRRQGDASLPAAHGAAAPRALTSTCSFQRQLHDTQEERVLAREEAVPPVVRPQREYLDVLENTPGGRLRLYWSSGFGEEAHVTLAMSYVSVAGDVIASRRISTADCEVLQLDDGVWPLETLRLTFHVALGSNVSFARASEYQAVSDEWYKYVSLVNACVPRYALTCGLCWAL